MAKRVAKIVLNMYVILTFTLIVACLSLMFYDCGQKAVSGEFKIFPVLNMAQFRSDVPPKEESEMIVNAVKYADRLDENGQGIDDPLWRLVNISTILVLCNLPLCYLMRLLDIKLSRRVFKLLLISCGIALLLIIAVRVYMENSYGSVYVDMLYTVAYMTWREFMTAVLAFLGALFLIKVFTLPEKK